MKPALVDVPVLILFFNRPQQLSQVFEQVKKARPSRLFLYQDGARNEHDLPGIKACREIVSQIDWECEVERFYQEKNFGCDPSEYISQKWAFSKVDKCIVLEDDDVPSVSFFRFCKEMLDKYEHDTRISMIAGFNPEEISKDIPYDYFFATTFSIWGWASWKRVVDGTSSILFWTTPSICSNSNNSSKNASSGATSSICAGVIANTRRLFTKPFSMPPYCSTPD